MLKVVETGTLRRSNQRRCSLKKGALKIFSKLLRKTYVYESQACNFIKKRI